MRIHNKLLRSILILSLIGLVILPSGAMEGGNPALYNAHKSLDDLGVKDAWNMGYTGKGVNIAIIDFGIDFATPDLIGTQARVSNVSSPYYGWPIVIDLESLSYYQDGTSGFSSHYANTTSMDVRDYQVTGTSKSGIYHIGDHPDQHLAQFYGQPVKVLVVDESVASVYDTVYVDLNNNHDFGDDKPCRKGDEASYWDRDNDGYPDESGGMVYFIADGKTPLPLSRMLYGEKAKIPKNGELIAFHCDDDIHGTMCASIIAAQGKNIMGIAPDARIISVRLGKNEELLWLLAVLGYDGVPNTGDEADVVSRSGGFMYRLNKGADEGSAFLEYLSTNVSPSTTMIFVSGNDGSGYGTCNPPSGEHAINVGATYDQWWNNSSYRGDVTCFSSRGPNALGQVKPNVLAPGDHIPESLPLWITHSGKAAWDNHGGGTSGATPHAAAVVALIYQAYKEAHGEFPTSEKARDILMSSATDINEEIFAQGSGMINAAKAVEIASGSNGVLIEPALLVTTPVEAGSTLKFNFTLTNHSGRTVSLKPQILIKDKTWEFTQSSANESILAIPEDMLTCNLLKVSSYYSRDARNTKLEKNEGYDIYLYNWEDMNEDGEIQNDELEIVALNTVAWGYGFSSEARMHDPSKRVNDGLAVVLKKRGEIQSNETKVVVEAYNWTPWDIGMNINGSKMSFSIPVPNTTGVFQGKLLLEGDDGRQCIPISFSAYKHDDISLSNTEEIYENDKIYGRFEGDGKGGWDTRFYPLYHHGHDLANIDVTWEDPNTDIDVYLYGESAFNASDLWTYSTKPPVNLPKLKILRENGHSRRILGDTFIISDEGVAGGPSYNVFSTSTGENREVITGELTNGLNLIVLRQVVPGGNEYGENVSVKINITPLDPINFTALAGETLNLTQRNAGVDSIVGFSKGDDLKSGGYLETFQAEEGDLLLIRSNCTIYKPQIFFDSNRNGTIDRDTDELIFGEQRFDDINPSYSDIITIHKKGTYFFMLVDPECHLEFYHMKNRYNISSSEPTKIRVPKLAGKYLGIAENDGKFNPLPVKLLVESSEPASVCLDAVNRTDRSLPFEVKLEVQDRFGNLVENTTNAIVEFDNAKENVSLIKGLGSINLTAPDKAGRYKIKAQSKYGVAEKDIEIADKALIEMGNASTNNTGIADEINEVMEARDAAPMKMMKDPPENVESVSVLLVSGNISLTWQPSDGADHYNVYRLKYGALEKLAEVKSPEYTMKGELWKSYTFRISAVNSEGNESELSDPVGIVVTP